MKRALLCGLVTLTCGWGIANAADKTTDREGREIREIAGKYATCLIQRELKGARAYVVDYKRPPGNGECLNSASKGMGGKMRFPGENYRYVLAEALLLRDYPGGLPEGVATGAVPKRAAPEPLDEANLPKNAKRAAAEREAYARRRAVWLFAEIGECVARASPSGSFALVKTVVASAAERSAFDALKPAIAGCLPADGTFKLNKATLRGTIATNLYQLAYAVRTPPNA